jgi:aminomuconate-semialdehyde/2-hydroxymuconate-6-semialdehyde dehydrogenase
MRPTILTGLPPIDCRIQQEEIFGPVITISPFKTEEEVISYTNGTKYGLSCCLWTENIKKAYRVQKQIQASFCFISYILCIKQQNFIIF